MATRPPRSESFADLRAILDRWSAAAPGDAALRVLLGAALDQEANTLFDQGLAEEARATARTSFGALATATRSRDVGQGERRTAPITPRCARTSWGSRRIDGDTGSLATPMAQRGAVGPGPCPPGLEATRGSREGRWRALGHVERAPAQRAGRPGFHAVGRALVIGYGKTPVSDRARAVRELELEQAAECVRLAIARGFNDLRKLRSHPDSRFLLSRDELKPLIMDMAFPDWPFGDE